MMSEAFLQILQLLAYLAIGLISVTFPIYAISVTFLRQEKRETEKEREKRIEKLKKRISELTSELKVKEDDRKPVTQLKEQIEKLEIELKGTELGVQYLTAKGAVGIPVQYLAIALASAGVGIYSFYESNWLIVLICLAISVVFFTFAVFSLYSTISAVEYAALRPAQTVDFDLMFGGKEKSKRVKVGKGSQLRIHVIPEDYVENFRMYAIFPPELEIPKGKERPRLRVYYYPENTQISIERTFVPKDTFVGFRIGVIPKKVGKYIIAVWLYGKGIYEQKKELIVNVVK